jgi:hypothetical protein
MVDYKMIGIGVVSLCAIAQSQQRRFFNFNNRRGGGTIPQLAADLVRGPEAAPAYAANVGTATIPHFGGVGRLPQMG